MTCPICEDPACPSNGYALMWERYASGRDRDHWKRIHDQMNNIAPPYPSLATQAGNAISAAGRVIAAAVTGQPVAVDQAEQGRRLAICRACDRFDPVAGRCTACGCVGSWKARLATEHCPLPEPKW